MADEADRTDPGLGPYRGPVVVLGLIAAIVVGGLLIALVGAVRAPDDVSNSATVLGTFPIDPDAEGIPPGPADPAAGSAGPAVSTVPGASTTEPSPPSGPGAGVDAFDGDLAAWEPVAGEWSTEEGELVVPAATDAAPAFLLGLDEADGIGAEMGTPARAAGLVVGYDGPGTYVAALAVPGLGGWRLEARVDGEDVANASVPAATGAGTVVALLRREGEVALLVDGEEAGVLEVPDGLGGRVGFVARGPAGGRWAAALGSRAG